MSVCGRRISYLWGLYNIQVVATGFSTLMKQETDIFARTGFRYRCESCPISVTLQRRRFHVVLQDNARSMAKAIEDVELYFGCMVHTKARCKQGCSKPKKCIRLCFDWPNVNCLCQCFICRLSRHRPAFEVIEQSLLLY